MNNNHKHIVEKYKKLISNIIIVPWDITLKEYKVSFSEKFDAGEYELTTVDGYKVASWKLVPMINCCGILVSTSSWIGVWCIIVY
jgi:hypothetical protein